MKPSEHTHVWAISIGGVFCVDKDCEEEMGFDEAEAILNEHNALKRYVVHDELCFKNQALRDLGVGGPIASCTCGLDALLTPDKE